MTTCLRAGMTAPVRDLARWALLPLICLLAPTPAAAQEGTEIIRGRVATPDREPIAEAQVTITGVQTQAVRTTQTNDKGVYTALFTTGDGEYIVAVRRIGFAPTTTRVTRTGESSVLVADVTLTPRPVQLEAITVTADRPPAPRSDEESIGGLEYDLLDGALFSLDPSDLTALAAAVPGVMAIPDADGDSSAFSVLGAPPDQNNIVVDGSTFGGSTLPADAIADARLVTTTFDPARGQFSGGQVRATTRGGTDLFQGTLRATRADRRLAWADETSTAGVPQHYSLSGSAGGPIRRGKVHYFAAVEMNRSSHDAFSLLEPRASLLGQYGLSTDTVAALTSTLGALGVPLTTGAIPDDGTNLRQSAFLRFDVTPGATTSLTVRADGAWQRQGGRGISAFGYPSTASESRSGQLGVQVSGSGYVAGLLDEFRTYLQRSTSRAAPYLALPAASVRVGVRYEDGRDGLTSLRFGGGSGGDSETESRKWETTNEVSWLATSGAHRLKFGQMLTLERTTSSQVADRFGTFTYESLDDLTANRPASYARTLRARERASSTMSGALWVGDEWRASSRLQVQSGLRLDLARGSTIPPYNPVVDSAFGLRTDRVPRDIGFSPRLGFSWQLSRGRPAGPVREPEGVRGGSWGRGGGWGGRGMRGMGMGGRGRRWQGPLMLSGGVGAFRGVIPPSRIAGLADATGLPSTTRYLTCVGDATPSPDWGALGESLPEECLDGSAPVEFAAAQPNVTVFDPAYRAPVSWRGNLGLEGLRVAGWRLGLSGTASLGLSGESAIDLNLRRAPAFTLPEEGHRPVFTSLSGIVPATGTVAPGASRVRPEFGRVNRLVSDLRSVATQFQATLGPSRPLLGKLPLSLSYTYSHQRAQERGFAGSTAGDPFAVEWAPSAQPTHQVQLNTSVRAWWFGLAVRLNALSGTAYTPVVAGDVNGDGAWNDRAFIFDPAAASDSTLAAQVGALLSSAPRSARECLRAQLGQIAGRNSCRTGWQLRADLGLSLTPPQNLGVGDRLRVSVTMANASGALLRLLGLADTPLGRTMAVGSPDPTLLYVTGFDSTAQRYQYRVNQLFGEVQSYGGQRRRSVAPFQLQLGLEYRFGGPRRDAMARRLGFVAEGRGAPLTADEIRARVRRLNRDPIEPVLARRDSLRLTAAQVDSLTAIRAEFVTRADSVSAPLVAYLVERGSRVSDAELTRRLGQLGPAMRRLMLAATERAAAVLTEEQRGQLPGWFGGRGRRP